MQNEIIILDEVDSTNSWLSGKSSSLPGGTIVAARAQTAGRGQRGNSWESAPDANVTMSMLLRPAGLEIGHAFPLSEAVALGVVSALAIRLPAEIVARVAIKWPNDIYVGNSKIAGILIENSLRGNMIDRSIAGIGLNVNQREFLSDAPNPVSMFQLTGATFDVGDMIALTGREVLESLALMQRDLSSLHQRYMARLWRGKGVHPFVETATGRRFEAEVTGVAPSGHITLSEHPSGCPLTYAFKEIAWTL